MGYVDLRMPTKQGWIYAIAGVVGILVFYVLVAVAVSMLSLPSSENNVMTYIGDDPTMVLIMIGVVFFFNAPAEEFLFRNVVQSASTRRLAAPTRSSSPASSSRSFTSSPTPSSRTRCSRPWSRL